MLATVQLDATTAGNLQVATDRWRAGLKAAANRLADLGGLKSGLTVEDATDVLWFYFGYSGFFTLMDDNGWSPERAEKWLREMAAFALLRD